MGSYAGVIQKVSLLKEFAESASSCQLQMLRKLQEGVPTPSFRRTPWVAGQMSVVEAGQMSSVETGSMLIGGVQGQSRPRKKFIFFVIVQKVPEDFV